MSEDVDGSRQRVAPGEFVEPVEIDREGLQQRGEVGRVPLTGHEALGEADVAGRQHPGDEAEVPDDQAALRARRCAVDAHLAA